MKASRKRSFSCCSAKACSFLELASSSLYVILSLVVYSHDNTLQRSILVFDAMPYLSQVFSNSGNTITIPLGRSMLADDAIAESKQLTHNTMNTMVESMERLVAQEVTRNFSNNSNNSITSSMLAVDTLTEPKQLFANILNSVVESMKRLVKITNNGVRNPSLTINPLPVADPSPNQTSTPPAAVNSAPVTTINLATRGPQIPTKVITTHKNTTNGSRRDDRPMVAIATCTRSKSS